ncbi:MAG: transglutaminase family protein [Hyphomicrobium sp.]|uniref:transglutaminase-like domain-containing protein n=1 Tax=Hyphomicrobium sp. TaxID=82 RepID=UPI00132B2EB3|nr:transglutaminase family protein [Hyphomicrobium sp.]KAB2940416.1 MAG: transglutaminase family protein [Hyphomicrobium sp.]MBZ0208247.1 transglutaminase family protein [Hyphomicrobium sp.]
MLINYGYEIGISVPRATPLICLLDVHPERRKDINSEAPFHALPAAPSMMYLDGFGNQCRRLMAPAGDIMLRLDGTIVDSGKPDEVAPHAREVPVELLPHYLLSFLLGSRYCETDRLSQVAWDLFGSVKPGWTRVQAICDFVHSHLTFGYEHARGTRTALEAFEEKKGVCRDFAHLMIALCRCLNIPARYVNGFLGDIGVPPSPAPMDFSAWTEVYLENRWCTFDARHNTPRIGRIVVARGRDATDVPLVNSFGPHTLKTFKVWTDERPPEVQAASA